MDGDQLRRLVDEVVKALGGKAEVQLDEVEECDPSWEPGPECTSVRHNYVVHVIPDISDISGTIYGPIRHHIGPTWQITERPSGETLAVDFTHQDGTLLGVTFDPDGKGPVVVRGRTGCS